MIILCVALSSGTSGCAGGGRAAPGLDDSLRLARQQLASGQAESARRILVDARPLAEDDDDRQALAIAMGDCLFRLGQYATASDEYFKARGLSEGRNPDQTYLASLGLARSRQAEGQWASAERHYLEAVSVAPRSEQRDRAYLELGRGALAAGDRQKARAYADLIEDGHLLGVAELRSSLEGPVVARGGETAREEVEVKLPSVLAPEIIDRSRWGAQPVRQSGNPEPMEKPWRITIHHSADPETPPTSFAQAAEQMRKFQTFHQDDRGWADIGYHYVIDGAGRIWEGRPRSIQGAHAGSRELNRGNIGVCLMGNFSKLDPTPDQKKALRRLLSYLCESEGISPRAIVGHRAGMRGITKDTLCPGARLEAYLIRLIPFLPKP